MPGNRIRTSRMVSSRVSPVKPGAMAAAISTADWPVRLLLVKIVVRHSLAERAARLLHEIRLDEQVGVAVEHAVDVADLLLRPVILDELVRMQDVAADLAAECDSL